MSSFAGEKAINIVKEAEKRIKYKFEEIDDICEYNIYKVLNAMQNHRLSLRHFNESTGYAYDDEGREITEKIYAQVFGGEAALVRPQIVSGTHAISLMLYGVLRPGDTLLSITGDPYDTIRSTIGINDNGENLGSLKDYNVNYDKVDLKDGGEIDFDEVEKKLNDNVKAVFIQRSSGYTDAKALSIRKIEEACKFVKGIKKDVLVLVDNCYGEFLEKKEPIEVGADLIAGSLIKNPGGGLVSVGGYIIGSSENIKKVASRLTAPGIALEVGANLGVIRSYLQGLFMASKVTSGAIKGAILAASVFESIGYRVFPGVDDERSDIIQAVVLGSREKVCAYCEGIQEAAPVDSYVTPEPWDMPGYDDQVIMAAGNFIEGSSIELSADAPMKEPYIVYQQGGLTYEHSKIGTIKALDKILKLDEVR
ncbi:methionine gamma-lyase family protein [Anaerofustis stercorihominis]|uniref:Aluminum resistance protein n=2 Tax=Anaerofustis stercorihominis TaxID=214853 RepID=B1C6T7_9FIRM|nr:methionine gamma-lyase family protein [Anaerofustis stercorihominis]EDS72724.1 aluminum resistance protein [Anaerofustis stercorihominis DSM 17244]MCQ4794098.1 methionine gamma-lyase family protein [Anaerofustis stercorihominis]